MNFRTPALCFSLAHPYFIAFAAACLRYAVFSSALYTSFPSLPLLSTTVSCSLPTLNPSCLDAAAAGLRDGLVTRTAGDVNVSGAVQPKRLYYVSPGAKRLVAADGNAGGLQVVAVGVKAFERQAAPGAKCAYRLTQEGLDSMLPFLEKQIVRASAAEVEAILRRQQGEPQTAEAQRKDLLRDPDAPQPMTTFSTISTFTTIHTITKTCALTTISTHPTLVTTATKLF